MNYRGLFDQEFRFYENGKKVLKTPDWLIFNEEYLIILDCCNNNAQFIDKLKKYAKPSKSDIVYFTKARYQKEPSKFDLCVLVNGVNADCEILKEINEIDHDYDAIVLLGVNKNLKVVTLLCDTRFSDNRLNQLFLNPGKKFPNPLPEIQVFPKNTPVQAHVYCLLLHLKDNAITAKDSTFNLSYVLDLFPKLKPDKARSVIRALQRLQLCYKIKGMENTWELSHKFTSTYSMSTRRTLKALELLRSGKSIEYVRTELEKFTIRIGLERRIRKERTQVQLTDYFR